MSSLHLPVPISQKHYNSWQIRLANSWLFQFVHLVATHHLSHTKHEQMTWWATSGLAKWFGRIFTTR